LWIFLVSFFRDPERSIPEDPRALVSPADGTITYIETVPDADFPTGKAFRISIFLSVFNVHVNRAPRAAKVLSVRYFPGEFLDARDGSCAVRNEQLWIDLEDAKHGKPLRVKQISGAVARRIVCWLKPGSVLKAGERFGMIKFGSRTDVLLPADEMPEVQVRVGDKVRGGSTVLARW
jgi:phosphatidylserine decarboxylase